MSQSFKTWEEARAHAQAEANRLGMSCGIEHNKLFKHYAVFLLPRPENRFGHELRCEVVDPMTGRKHAATTNSG